MKDAGTTKNGFLTSNPSISFSYSLRYGSVVEYCFNSSEMDSKFVRRSFSVTSGFILTKAYIFNQSPVKRKDLYISRDSICCGFLTDAFNMLRHWDEFREI